MNTKEFEVKHPTKELSVVVDREKEYCFIKTWFPNYDASPIEIGSVVHYDKTESCCWRVHKPSGDFTAGFTDDRFKELIAQGYIGVEKPKLTTPDEIVPVEVRY